MRKLCGNFVFPQNFHTRNLGVITAFYATWNNRWNATGYTSSKASFKSCVLIQKICLCGTRAKQLNSSAVIFVNQCIWLRNEKARSKIKIKKKYLRISTFRSFRGSYLLLWWYLLLVLLIIDHPRKRNLIPYLKNPVMVQKIPRKVLVGSRYSRMDQLKFVEDSL